MVHLVPNAVATTLDRQAERCHRRACHHITVLRLRCPRTIHHQRWPHTVATQNIAILPQAWTNTDRTEQPRLEAAMEPVPVRPKEDTAQTGTAKVATEVPLPRPQVTPPEPSTMPVTTTTVLERTTPGIKPDTRKTTASLTVRLRTTVQFPPKPTPVNSMTTGQRTPVTTRKPTRRAMQRPISTLMVVITKAGKRANERDKQKQITMIERQRQTKRAKVCDCVCKATKRKRNSNLQREKTKAQKPKVEHKMHLNSSIKSKQIQTNQTNQI